MLDTMFASAGRHACRQQKQVCVCACRQVTKMPIIWFQAIVYTPKDCKTLHHPPSAARSTVAGMLARNDNHMQKEKNRSNGADLVALLLFFITDVQVHIRGLCLLLLQLLCVLKTFQCVSVSAWEQSIMRDAEREPKTGSGALQPTATGGLTTLRPSQAVTFNDINALCQG